MNYEYVFSSITNTPKLRSCKL